MLLRNTRLMRPSELVTWNPSDKSASITLSGSNLTATLVVGASDWESVRASKSRSGVKRYFEITIGTGPFMEVGVGNGSMSLASYLSDTSNGIGYRGDSGEIRINDVVLATAQTYTSGDTLRAAIDDVNDRAWFSKVGQNWNGSGTANPATNTGGVDISAITGALFPALAMFANGHSATVNFGDTPFAGTIPAGFDAWRRY